MIPAISAIQSGLSAVRNGTSRLDAAAAELSTAYLPQADGVTAPEPDVPGLLVELMLAKHDVGIGAKVIERASEAQKSLLDILA
jgi:hypothetical protein